jgi:hypothetical protein
LALVFGASSASGAERFSFAPCTLIETLPAKGDPASQAKSYQRLFKTLAKQSPSRKNMARLHSRFVKRTGALLAEAQRTFQPASKKPSKRKMRQFLKRHVLTPYPSLVVADEGFMPTVAVQSALAYTACRAGKVASAIAFARTSQRRPGPLVAYGALLLIEQQRLNEARELLPHVGTRGFLAPWVQAQLAVRKVAALSFHKMASTRVQLPVQRNALNWQKGQLAQRTD